MTINSNMALKSNAFLGANCLTKDDFISVVDSIRNYVKHTEDGVKIRQFLDEYKFDTFHNRVFARKVINEAERDEIGKKISNVIGAVSTIKREQKFGQNNISQTAKEHLLFSLIKIKEILINSSTELISDLAS